MSKSTSQSRATESSMQGGNRYAIHMQKQMREIVRAILGIPLQTNGARDFGLSDRLSPSVVMQALKAAYAVGRRDALTGADAMLVPGQFDAYEITPMRPLGEPYKPGSHSAEPCEPEDAEFWSLFGHIPHHGVRCIGDFETRQDAEEILSRITGENCPIDED